MFSVIKIPYDCCLLFFKLKLKGIYWKDIGKAKKSGLIKGWFVAGMKGQLAQVAASGMASGHLTPV